MQHKLLTGSSLVIACIAAPIAAGASTVVDFTEAAKLNRDVISTPTDTQGLTFSSPHYHLNDDASPSFGGNVTPLGYLYVDGPKFGSPVTVTQTGGGLFSLLQLDSSKLWGNSAAAAAENLDNAEFLHLVGHRAGGSTVTADLALSFGFSTYTLNGFSNLESVLISGFVTNGTQDASWAIDNIIYAPVPEASTIYLMLAGLGALTAVCRLRRQAGKASRKT